MSEQKNQIIIAVTLALVSVFILGGVSFSLFPSQVIPSTLPQIASIWSTLPSQSPSTKDPVFSISVALPMDGICIDSDGNINSTSAPIKREGETFTFTGDILNHTIVVKRDNIIIDGAGHTLQGFKQGSLAALDGINLEGTSNVTIKNLQITQYWQGIWIQNGVNITIINDTLVNTNWGVSANSVNNTRIISNTLNEMATAIGLTSWYGFGPSMNNLISTNNITDATTGVGISFGSSNTVTGNNFANVYIPIVAGENATVWNNNMVNGIDGINVESRSVVYQNNIFNFTESGLSVNGVDSIIFENYVANSSHGVIMNAGDNYPLGNNTLYHNNFVNNIDPLLLLGDASKSVNFWDNGKEGNYWSNYNGTDDKVKGIGDAPFTVDQNNVDRYPLMEPYFPQADNEEPFALMLFVAGGTTAAVGVSVLSFSIIKQKKLKNKNTC
jgi:nitrous oxidase accessory protein NosD